jgi:archaemetzincin
VNRRALVHLIPIYLAGLTPLLRQLAAHIAQVLGTPVTILPLRFDPENAFDPSRGQYNSTLLLSHLLAEGSATGARILGVAGVDLFIPILTYVFGEAQLGGQVAVVSTYRLDNSLYGLPPNQDLLLARMLKESTHELGHTYGLIHCDAPDCVMHASTYVEDIDLKSARFCQRCQKSVRVR